MNGSSQALMDVLGNILTSLNEERDGDFNRLQIGPMMVGESTYTIQVSKDEPEDTALLALIAELEERVEEAEEEKEPTIEFAVPVPMEEGYLVRACAWWMRQFLLRASALDDERLMEKFVKDFKAKFEYEFNEAEQGKIRSYSSLLKSSLIEWMEDYIKYVESVETSHKIATSVRKK